MEPTTFQKVKMQERAQSKADKCKYHLSLRDNHSCPACYSLARRNTDCTNHCCAYCTKLTECDKCCELLGVR